MDHELRELERRVRESPGDEQARARLAAALRRQGERSAHWPDVRWPPRRGDVVGPWQLTEDPGEIPRHRLTSYAPGLHADGTRVSLALYPIDRDRVEPAEVEAAELAAWSLDPDLAELSGTAGEVAWVVMHGEWAPGAAITTLAARVEREGPLAVREAARLALSVAERLERLTSAGRFAWDVTPRTLVESRAGTVGLLFDARRTPHQPLWISQSITGPVPPLGTPLFAPPELMRGTRETNAPRRDVHHAGMSLRWTLTGRGARDHRAGESALDFFKRLQDEPEVEPLIRSRPDVPPALAALADATLRRDPEVRWPHDASALVAELRRFLADEPLATPPELEPEPEPEPVVPAPGGLARALRWLLRR